MYTHNMLRIHIIADHEHVEPPVLPAHGGLPGHRAVPQRTCPGVREHSTDVEHHYGVRHYQSIEEQRRLIITVILHALLILYTRKGICYTFTS